MISEHTFAVARAVKSSRVESSLRNEGPLSLATLYCNGSRGYGLNTIRNKMLHQNKCFASLHQKQVGIYTQAARPVSCSQMNHYFFSFDKSTSLKHCSRYMIWWFYRLIVYKSANGKTINLRVNLRLLYFRLLDHCGQLLLSVLLWAAFSCIHTGYCTIIFQLATALVMIE